MHVATGSCSVLAGSWGDTARGVFNVPHVWLWSVGCCTAAWSLPQGEDAALMGAMGAETVIWLGDTHVGG